MSQNDHIITLIAKQLQGWATPQEAEELQQWLHSDAGRRQEYDEMVMIWQKAALYWLMIPHSTQQQPG